MSESLVTHRKASNDVALIFVHGFGGEPTKTWGQFPEFLLQDSRLHNWDMYSVGYPSGLGLDLVGIWKANPSIDTIAKSLITYAKVQFTSYQRLALVVHSMGGLVVQRALVDDHNFVKQVGHVFFFGTPSRGLKKALFFQFWKRQIDNMAEGGSFITDLRDRWDQTFSNGQAPFQYWVTAGDQDEFVPRHSSQMGFPEDRCCVVPGDHLSIVKPEHADSLSVQIVVGGLAGNANTIAIADAAQRAIEHRQFQEAISLLEPKKEGLDERGVVELALAYESVGRHAEALTVLHDRHADETDAMGVLAGRLKRRWLLERQAQDAKAAQNLYRQGFEQSVRKNHLAQAYYHGINLAFMSLAYDDNFVEAQNFAKQAIAHCKEAKEDKWQRATLGEAYLLLGDADEAVRYYASALAAKPAPTPREVDSMLQQALKVSSVLGYEDAADRLMVVFGRAHA
ncbi:tetratricopeptide repeat-containing protein [Nitrospira sp. M1]